MLEQLNFFLKARQSKKTAQALQRDCIARQRGIKVLSELQEIKTIHVYDLLGRELISKKYLGSEHAEELNLSALATGIYIIQVNDLYTQKITKL